MSTELIVGFNGGEVSRNIESRVDLPLYKRSCSIMENFDVLPEGGARNRSGTKFIGKTKGTTVEGDETAHLIDFSYSDDQSYIFELGELYLRIYSVQDEALVQDLITPYSIDDVKTIQWERSYDVMWLVHPNYPDQTLTRTTVSNFTIEETIYDFPPMLDENITATTITPSGYTGSISLLASTGIFQAGHIGSYWFLKQDRTTALEAPAGFQRGLSTPIVGSGTSDWLFVGFSDWRVETGGTWKGQVKAELSQDQGVTISDTIIIADTTGGTNQNFIYDSEIRGGKNEWIRIVCTAGTTGTVNTTDVYTYGLVKITSFTDALNVGAEVISELYDASVTKRWSEGSFSGVNGYPRTITLFEERRWLSGTNTEPNMVWGSTTDDFYNYFIGTRDDESIRRAPPVNGFSTWLDSKEQLFLCTTNELITITGLTSSQGLTPENFKFNVQSGFGSEYLQNELTNDVILYVEKGRKKLRELIYSRDELNFQSNDVSALSKHITKQGIGTTALQKLPDQRLMCVLDNGELAPFTYERTEEIIAWQRYVTDGNYESVAVAPNGDVDSTWYVVERDGEHFIEIQQIRDDSSYWFLDSAVEFDGGACIESASVEIIISSLISLDNSTLLESFSVAGSPPSRSGVTFKPDGTKFYAQLNTVDRIFEYTTVSPWVITGATNTAMFDLSAFSPPNGGTPSDLQFSPDGLKMWSLDIGQREIWEYALTTAWDISTLQSPLSSSGNILSDFGYIPTGFNIANSGNNIYICELSGDIYQHELSTPNDISSIQAGISFDVSVDITNPTSVFLSTGGNTMLVSGSDNDVIVSYLLTNAFDITTAEKDSSLDISTQSGISAQIYLDENTLSIYVIDGNTSLHRYSAESESSQLVKVTSPSHGLINGANIRFENCTNIILNESIFTVSDVTTNTFLLKIEDGSEYYDGSVLSPKLINVSGAGTLPPRDPNGDYTLNALSTGDFATYDYDDFRTLKSNVDGTWLIVDLAPFGGNRYTNPYTGPNVPKENWIVSGGASPAPLISYDEVVVGIVSDVCVVSNTVDNLGHLEGKEIGVICDENNDGKYLVASGSVNLDGYCNQAIAGLPYVSTLSPLPIELIAQTFTVGRQKSVVDMVIKLKDSIGGLLGSNLNKMEAIAGRTLADPIGQQLDPINDDIKTYSLDSWEIIKRIYIQQDLPLPFEVLSISMDVRGKGR